MTQALKHSLNPSSRAIVFAVCPDEHLIENDRPLCQLPLGPKTIIQHVIESAVRFGARRVDVIISEGARELRELLGEGHRWGISLRIHVVADPQRPYGVFRFLCRTDLATENESILILHTSSLVVDALKLRCDASADTVAAFMLNDQRGDWSGVARASVGFLNQPEFQQMTYEHFSDHISACSNASESQAVVLSLSTPAKILKAQARILSGEFPDLLENYRTAENGIWIGRNTQIHPLARIIAPAFISENCEIEERATIGPAAYLGERTIIGSGAVIENTMVLAMSSVGEELTLQDSIASRTMILNTRLGISLNIVDDVLLGDLGSKSISQELTAQASRLAGLGVFILTIPLLGGYWLLTRNRTGMRLTWRSCVRTPCPQREFLWRCVRLPGLACGEPAAALTNDRRGLWCDLIQRIVPSLYQVVAGKIRLAGAKPRTVAEAAEIPEFWKPIILDEPAGLIYESLTQHGPASSDDECCSGDMWFAMSQQRLRSMRLLIRYVRSLISGPLAVRSVRSGNVKSSNNRERRSVAAGQMREREFASVNEGEL